MIKTSETRLRDFLKGFGNKFANKSSPKKICDFWRNLQKINLCKNLCGYYLGNFWKHLGNFFPSTSGHTDQDIKEHKASEEISSMGRK